jgi:hypothetical protein
MSPNAEVGDGLQGLSQWVQLCTWSPNKLWRSNSIFNLCWQFSSWPAKSSQHARLTFNIPVNYTVTCHMVNSHQYLPYPGQLYLLFTLYILIMWKCHTCVLYMQIFYSRYGTSVYVYQFIFKKVERVNRPWINPLKGLNHKN